MLIERGPKPEHHRAPWSPVIICTAKHTANWEVGDSNAQSSLWSLPASEVGGGWLLERYKGFNIDYGSQVKLINLWDGTVAGFAHDRNDKPFTLLKGAVWWSYDEMPEWLREAGVVYPSDEWTKSMIRKDLGSCRLGQSREEKLMDRRYEQYADGYPDFLA